MEYLKTQINVLRVIALRRPNAHIAFCYHAPYRKLYHNDGEVYNLVCAYGKWRSPFDSIFVYNNIFRLSTWGNMNPLLPSFFVFKSHEIHVAYDIQFGLHKSRNVTKSEFIPNMWCLEGVDEIPGKTLSKSNSGWYDYKPFLKKWTVFYQHVYDMAHKKKHLSYKTMKPFFIDQIDSFENNSGTVKR